MSQYVHIVNLLLRRVFWYPIGYRKTEVTMIKAGIPHEEGLIKWLKQSPERQREYLKASIEENSDMPQAIMMAIREIALARGYEALAKDAGLSQKSLYKILSEDKDIKPRFETIAQIVKALGMRITVEPIEKDLSKNASS